MQQKEREEARRQGVASLSRIVLIMAGGSGVRAGGGVPKQMRRICGVPMLVRSVRAFLVTDCDYIVVVLNPVCRPEWEALKREYPELDTPRLGVCDGGCDRLRSVAEGLGFVDKEYRRLGSDTLVAVHDAARPMVSADVIRRGWETAAECGCAVPVVALSDSIREVDDEGSSMSVDRGKYRAVQTPQVFRGDILLGSYSRELQPSMTDDASVCEAAGHTIALYEGDPANIKVTNPIDFAVAEALIGHSGE